MTYDALRATLLALIDVAPEDFEADGDLIDYGLDSIKVFELITAWQGQGLKVDFASLGEVPTLAGWWRVIGPQVSAAP